MAFSSFFLSFFFSHPSHVAAYLISLFLQSCLQILNLEGQMEIVTMNKKIENSFFFWLIIYNTCNCDLLYNIIENKFSLLKNSTSGDPAWLFFLTNAWKKHGNTMEVLHREMVVEEPRKYHGSMVFINGSGKTTEIPWKYAIH